MGTDVGADIDGEVDIAVLMSRISKCKRGRRGMCECKLMKVQRERDVSYM